MKLYSKQDGSALHNPRRISREQGESRKAFDARKKEQEAAVALVEHGRFIRLVKQTARFWRYMGLDPKEWLEG